jgi:hypothetical protein
MAKDFIIGDVLNFGWRVMKSHLGLFVAVLLSYAGIYFALGIVEAVLESTLMEDPQRGAIKFALGLFEQALGILLGIGLIKIALSFCDQVRPTVGTLFSGLDCFWRYVGATILYGLIVLGGTLLLIIPGIIWAIQFQLCYYFVVDRGLGPIDALKASSRTTRGVKLKLFGFGILCALINLLGALCLLVGLVATVPTTMVAMALVYRHLMMQTPELEEFGIRPFVPEPAPQPAAELPHVDIPPANPDGEPM